MRNLIEYPPDEDDILAALEVASKPENPISYGNLNPYVLSKLRDFLLRRPDVMVSVVDFMKPKVLRG